MFVDDSIYDLYSLAKYTLLGEDYQIPEAEVNPNLRALMGEFDLEID